MNKMVFKNSIALYCSVFFLSAATAQEKPVAGASLEKNRILLGEQVRLTIGVSRPAGQPGGFFRVDSIPHFEILEKSFDTVSTGTLVTIQGVYTITSFDSGHHVIPSFVLEKNIRTDTIGVDVVYSDFDATRDYHDIKDILEVEAAGKKTGWYYAAGGLLLLLLLLWYLLRRKKPAEQKTAAVLPDPYGEAIRRLGLLEKEKPGARQYHTRLAEIFRTYVAGKKSIRSLQETTGDLVIQLKNLELDREQFDRLSQALRLGDFVKFAKYTPPDEDNRVAFESIRTSIEAIENMK